MSSDPFLFVSVHGVAVCALLLEMFCPEHTERSECETHPGVLPGLAFCRPPGLPTRPVLYMGGGTGGLEGPRVSSSLDFLLMMG